MYIAETLLKFLTKLTSGFHSNITRFFIYIFISKSILNEFNSTFRQYDTAIDFPYNNIVEFFK